MHPILYWTDRRTISIRLQQYVHFDTFKREVHWLTCDSDDTTLLRPHILNNEQCKTIFFSKNCKQNNAKIAFFITA